MIHYHLGLICSWCLKYFTASIDTMHHHSQLCKLALVGVDNDNDNQEENPTLMTMVRMTSCSAKISTAPLSNQEAVNALPHCPSSVPSSHWEVVNALPCCSHQDCCSGFTTKCSGAYCPLSNEHNHSLFSQYCRLFIISKVLYLTQ